MSPLSGPPFFLGIKMMPSIINIIYVSAKFFTMILKFNLLFFTRHCTTKLLWMPHTCLFISFIFFYRRYHCCPCLLFSTWNLFVNWFMLDKKYLDIEHVVNDKSIMILRGKYTQFFTMIPKYLFLIDFASQIPNK